tara:strand:+ start:280 stop:636 length:357 start_codon:yes stop_codon:yes gene_type:complete
MPTLDISATITNTTTNETLSVRPDAFATTGEHEDSGVIEVGTSETTLTLKTDIGDAGYAIVVNRDSTNYVELGFSTGSYVVKLLAGQVALMPLQSTISAIYLRANTAACDVQYKIFEQ